MSKPATLYVQSGKPIERELANALLPKCKIEMQPCEPTGISVWYGVTQGFLPLWQKVLREKNSYVYIDNGYFQSKWHGGSYYKVTRDAMQHLGYGAYPSKRWDALDIPIKPWRRTGEHVLLACQTDFWYRRHGTTFADWVRTTTEELRKYTRRPIVVRHKPVKGVREPPISEAFENCWAVVTHTSNVAVDAVVAGVPVIALAECAASCMGRPDAMFIESLLYPDDELRYTWACNLAANQWTVDEVRAGAADHLFKERQ